MDGTVDVRGAGDLRLLAAAGGDERDRPALPVHLVPVGHAVV